MSRPEAIDKQGIGEIFVLVGRHVGLAFLPIAARLLLRRARGRRRSGRA